MFLMLEISIKYTCVAPLGWGGIKSMKTLPPEVLHWARLLQGIFSWLGWIIAAGRGWNYISSRELHQP